MRLTRAQWLVGLMVFLTAIIAIVTNLATVDTANWLKPYSWIFWPVLLALIVLLVVISIIAATPSQKAFPLDKHRLDKFVSVVSNAEQITGIDPTLDKDEHWAEKFAEWEQAAKELSAAAGVDYAKIDKHYQKVSEHPARLLIRLAKAIMPALLYHGGQEQLTNLAAGAYVAARGLKDWASAAQMAYAVSQKLYQRQEYSEAKEWVNWTEQSLKNNIDTHLSQGQLRVMLLEMKGLIARDFAGDREEAKEYLHDALCLADELGDKSKKAQILVHTALLQEFGGHNGEAIELYIQALANAPDGDNPELTLECYDKLARLAVAQGQDDHAYNWAEKQLALAKQSLRRVYESRAHEQIGWYMYKRGNFKEAYYHARQALSIEEEIKGERVSSIRVFLITIADKALQQSVA